MASLTSFSKVIMNITLQGYIPISQGTMFYRIYGEGFPILVLHGGISIDHLYLMPSLLELAQHNKLIFYDRRGVGKSSDTPYTPEFLNIPQFIDDIEKIYTYFNYEKITILGHSWGAFLAMEYAIAHPEKVSSLILISPCPATYEGQQKYTTLNNQRSDSVKDIMKPLASFEEFSQLRAHDINTMYRVLFANECYNPNDVNKLTLQFDQKSGQNGYKSMMILAQNSWLQKETNLLPALKNLSISTLIIHGDHDTIPVECSQEIHQALSPSQLVIIPECGHYPFAEQPLLCFGAIHNFLRK